MEVTTITALAGVLGSMVGASATVTTAWVTQRTVNKREILQAEVRKREALYGEFIGECARLFMDAFSHSLEKPETLLPAYALINRIRLCASPPVLVEAERLLARIRDQYFAENLTVRQVWELTRADRADPMMAFAEACRTEFKSMLARI
jgi:hypothetical protein